MAELFHVGLTVKDLERSLRFYRDAAGMTAGEIFDGQSREFDSLTNNRGARLRGVHLKAGPFMLQLLEYKAGGVDHLMCTITRSAVRTFRFMCLTSKQNTLS